MAVFDPELAARMKMPKELLEKASELHLAIHAGAQQVYAALFDYNQSKAVWHVYADMPAGMSPYAFIYARNWVEGVFRKCTITFDCDNYALVPQSMFDSGSCADYLSMQNGVETSSVGFIEMPEVEASLCFEWPEWHAALMKAIPNARLVPLSALLVRMASSRAQQGEMRCVVAFTSGFVTIAGLKNKSLLLLATHEARTPEDVLYHVSNAAMRLQLDMENCRIDLLDTTSVDETRALLSRYLRDAQPLAISDGMHAPAITQLHYLCA